MLDIHVKELFFDRKRVINAISDGSRKVLSKFGAFVRTRAKTSIRFRTKGSASPGNPPFSHTGLLKKLIYFAYDENRRSVVIGPTPISRPGPGDIPPPSLLEHGGMVVRPRKKNGLGIGRPVTYRYRGNPYMAPALAHEQYKLPALWANSVK